VTARVIAELEEGRRPWIQPWDAARAVGPALPRNAATGRCYSGVNVLILWAAVVRHGFPSQAWLTFRQALDLGGAVRKGERGTTVVYANRFAPQGRDGEGGDDGGGEAAGIEASLVGRAPKRPGAIPFLKRFTVFNAAQVDGLPPSRFPDPAPLSEPEAVPVAEALIAASGVDFRVGGAQAFYNPVHDFVAVPPQPAFHHQINYYRTALHELTHATGHPSRLDRDQRGWFGSRDYAREELVAEMGAAFLCASLGIVPTVRHADYIAGWLDLLRSDSRAIFRAASAASKAADWLLARHTAASESRAA
jgi:antirestriction protein ArdC